MSKQDGNLGASYLGLSLSNPVIVGACGLTSNLKSIEKIADAGAGAIVTKSLFEEHVQLESWKKEEQAREANYRHPMMPIVFPEGEGSTPFEHITWVRRVKEAVSIPVIASLNAVNKDTWVTYAKELAGTGVDALELNLYASPRDPRADAHAVEQEQLEILANVAEAVNIPISAKLSPFYSNPLNVIQAMDESGVDGFVLFNQLFQPDIDIEDEDLSFPFNLSTPGDHRLPLRYAGLLYGNLSASVCCSTGILSGEDVIRVLLAGADCVQMVSTLYRNGLGQIRKVLDDITAWMEKHGYDSLDDFRGTLSRKNTNDPWAYTRAQYVRLLLRRKPLDTVWDV